MANAIPQIIFSKQAQEWFNRHSYITEANFVSRLYQHYDEHPLGPGETAAFEFLYKKRRSNYIEIKSRVRYEEIVEIMICGELHTLPRFVVEYLHAENKR